MTKNIVRNTYYNLIGSFLPQIIVFISVPLYLQKIGDARYGVLALVWLFLGYFGVLDLGLSRATANLIARLHDKPASERQAVFWTALMVNGSFGVLGSVCVLSFGDHILGSFLKMPDYLHQEILSTLPWMALSIPLMTMSGVLNGTLEARGSFLCVNIIQIVGSLFFQLIPLTIAYFYSSSLAWLIPAAILARLSTFLPLLYTALKAIPFDRITGPQKKLIRPLLGYGGWITITSIVAPLLTSFDQILIAKVWGPKEVAWYNVPYTLTWRLTLFPTSFLRVAFPEFSKMKGYDAHKLAINSLRFTGAAFTPIIIIAILLVQTFLGFWIGPELTSHSAPLATIFLIGIWFTSLGTILLTLLQARGRPDVAAKVFLLELLPFWGLLWVGIKFLGLEGVALASIIRTMFDLVIFSYLCKVNYRDILSLWPATVFFAGAWMVSKWLSHSSVLYWTAGFFLTMYSIVWSLKVEPRIYLVFSNIFNYLNRTQNNK